MTDMAAVEVTDPKYRVLRHEPTGATFDDNGKSVWPLDQFTLRLFAEGSVRLQGAAPAAASASAPSKEK